MHTVASENRASESTAAPTAASAKRTAGWRVIDIVVAAVIAVACGALFVAWNTLYKGPSALLEPFTPGLGGLLAGPWLLAGPLAGLIIRKPGAALFAELVAALLSTLVGNEWSALTLVSGLAQGIGAELVFAAFRYRVWKLPVALLAGALAGLGGGINDSILWYAGNDVAFKSIYITCTTLSGVVVAGLGSWLIVRALARSGALNRFASGRSTARRV